MYPFGYKMMNKLGLRMIEGVENNINWEEIPKPGSILFDDINEEIVFNLEDFGIYFDFPGMALIFKYSDVKNKKTLDSLRKEKKNEEDMEVHIESRNDIRITKKC